MLHAPSARLFNRSKVRTSHPRDCEKCRTSKDGDAKLRANSSVLLAMPVEPPTHLSERCPAMMPTSNELPLHRCARIPDRCCRRRAVPIRWTVTAWSKSHDQGAVGLDVLAVGHAARLCPSPHGFRRLRHRIPVHGPRAPDIATVAPSESSTQNRRALPSSRGGSLDLRRAEVTLVPGRMRLHTTSRWEHRPTTTSRGGS